MSDQPTPTTTDALAEALRAFIHRLKVVHNSESYKSVWTISQLHAGPYEGPFYGDELEALEAALAQHDAERLRAKPIAKKEPDSGAQSEDSATDLRKLCPKTYCRIKYLLNPVAIDELTDHFQTMGLPMGSDTWAEQALSRVRELEAAESLLRKLEQEWANIHERDSREIYRTHRKRWAAQSVARIEAREADGFAHAAQGETRFTRGEKGGL